MTGAGQSAKAAARDVEAGDTRVPRVVIVGGGFGGVSAARMLARANVNVALIDRRNYHLFQPLLFQVATAILQPADIAAPIRGLLFRHDRPVVVMDAVTGIDAERKVVHTKERRLEYDYLILAPGAQTSYFGNDEWKAKTFALKTLDDAERLRHQILLSFERAEMADDDAERRRLMTFVIVGGGPNGVGAAAATAELARTVLARDFRNIDATKTRVIVVEAADGVLPGFPDKLREAARRTLERKGVEIRAGAPCDSVEEHYVGLGDERIEAGTIIWTAGVEAPHVRRWLDVEADKSGRVKVRPDLSLPGQPDIFVVGDAAYIEQDGDPLPGLAAVAKQQGSHAARSILRRIADKETEPFRYRDYGTLVPLGRGAAVAKLGKAELTGFVAWMVWAAAHLAFLMDFRRMALVAFNWACAFVTSRRGARIIVSRDGTDVDVENPRKLGRDGDRRDAAA